MFELHPWQAREVAKHGNAAKRAIVADPRCGKTLATIESFKVGKSPGRTLIIAPKSVCPMWIDELRANGIAVVDMLDESAKTITTYLNAGCPKTTVLVLPYRKLTLLAKVLASKFKAANIIVDESHIIKGVATAQSKAVRALCSKAAWVRILTGTPAPNHYGDLWAQMSALDKEAWGTWVEFRTRYLVCHPIYPTKVMGYRNLEELQKRVASFTTFVKREDVFGKEEWQEVVRSVDMGPKAKALYTEFAKQFLLEMGNDVVLGNHALKRLTKMQQIAAGFVIADNGSTVDMHDAKVEAVLGDLGEILACREKVVLFHRFQWESDKYFTEIKKVCKNTYRINGGSTSAEREAAITAIRETPGPVVVIAQTACASLGISFANAEHAMFVSQGFSHAEERQARDRVFAPGKTKCVTYYRARGTIDAYVAAVVEGKKILGDAVTSGRLAGILFGEEDK